MRVYEDWNIYEICEIDGLVWLFFFFLNRILYLGSFFFSSDWNEHKRSAMTYSGKQSNFCFFIFFPNKPTCVTKQKGNRCTLKMWILQMILQLPPIPPTPIHFEKTPSLVIKKRESRWIMRFSRAFRLAGPEWVKGGGGRRFIFVSQFLTGNLPTYSINQASV